MGRFLILAALFLASCITTNNGYSTFKKYLTDAEKAELKQNKEINKVHAAYRKNGQVHWIGPLKVELQEGRYKFTPHGVWKGYYETGELFSETVINDKGQLEIEKIYEKDGIRTSEVIGFDVVVIGETVRKEKLINYYYHHNQDTLSISAFLRKGKKIIKDGLEKHFDENGNITKLILYKDGKKIKNNKQLSYNDAK